MIVVLSQPAQHCSTVLITAKRSKLVVNISPCIKLQLKISSEPILLHLYLILYYIFLIFTFMQEGVFLDRIYCINHTETYNLNAPTLVTSASHKMTTNMHYSFSKDTVFDGETTGLYTIHSFVGTCNVCPLAIPESCVHNIGLWLMDDHSLIMLDLRPSNTKIQSSGTHFQMTWE